MSELLITLIPGLPLLGFLLISLNVRRISHSVSSGIACLSIFAAFVLAVFAFLEVKAGTNIEFTLFRWIDSGSFVASFAFLVDALSSWMMLIITGVGFLIHVYSIGYMHGDEGYNRFFSYLNLFVFFMLLLVMGSNYLMMFIGWEGVGLCSFLLIGFWFKNPDYNKAANKAFIMNRIGDLGMLLGIILIFVHFDSIEYARVFPAVATADVSVSLTLIAILLFVGAMGKSAQLPLYTWLPDAMAGPTPVSALIHAATMVTAGIYMIARSNIIYTLSPVAQDLVTYTGLATAIFAATIAIAQNDIKKVLAYSTVSQLGLMFVALGVGAYSTGIFHMATHAFFKALLFLGAGSVIHAMHGEQDIRRMGGLKKHIPVTYVTFLIGVLAISGVPPFAGFFSKDEILADAFHHSPLVWAMAVLASLLTAFYMFRLLFLVFFGSSRVSSGKMDTMHESPRVMTVPLILLAVLSTSAGLLGIPEAFHATNWLKEFLSPAFALSYAVKTTLPLEHSTEYLLMGTILTLTILAIAAAYVVYQKRGTVPLQEGANLPPLHRLVYEKYFVDEIYARLITRPLHKAGVLLDKFVERLGIDRLVNSLGTGVEMGSRSVRFLQTGTIGFYLLCMVVGVIALLVFAVWN